MWKDLPRVDWNVLTHAYGHAGNLPRMLRQMVSADEAERAKGWDTMWGAVNHQGDFYDSTVACVPFLIEAAGRSDVPDRPALLGYLRSRWDDAPEYNGDPLVPDPPGGIDIPTPVREPPFDEVPAEDDHDEAEAADADDFDLDKYRRMDLCAWQTGRAIMAGRPTYRRLLSDPDPKVAAAAAELLIVWPADRPRAKRALVRQVDEQTDPIERGRRILNLGVYAGAGDAVALNRWLRPAEPLEVRAAAALVWAWLADPAPPPPAAAAALRDASEPAATALARLPWEGVFEQGLWVLPTTLTDVVLRLAESRHKDLRWRAVQGLEVGRATTALLSAGQVVPALARRLADRDHHVRESAAEAIAQRGPTAFDAYPAVVGPLVARLADAKASVAGNAARALAAMSGQLDPAQRRDALAGVAGAMARFAKSKAYVSMGDMGCLVRDVLSDARAALKGTRRRTPAASTLFAGLWDDFLDDSTIPLADCERLLDAAYAADPPGFIDLATRTVGGRNRSAAIGAARWLAKLGPDAVGALDALDRLAAKSDGDDPYLDSQAEEAAESIRQAAKLSRAKRKRAAADLDAVAAADGSAVAVGRAAAMLETSDVPARAAAARWLATSATVSPADVVSAVVDALVARLTDDNAVTVGIRGRVEADGRIYYWRAERQSPRAWAVRALLRFGAAPADDRALLAMLAESLLPAVRHGGTRPTMERFTPAEWRAAATLSGDPAAAEVRVRAARMSCQGQPDDAPRADEWLAAADELAAVAKRLSGRLV